MVFDVSTIRFNNLGSVQTAPEKFEIAAFFLRSGQPSTLIRHENSVFRKRSENVGFSFSCWTENILKNDFFENDGVTKIV